MKSVAGSLRQSGKRSRGCICDVQSRGIRSFKDIRLSNHTVTSEVWPSERINLTHSSVSVKLNFKRKGAGTVRVCVWR